MKAGEALNATTFRDEISASAPALGLWPGRSRLARDINHAKGTQPDSLSTCKRRADLLNGRFENSASLDPWRGHRHRASAETSTKFLAGASSQGLPTAKALLKENIGWLIREYENADPNEQERKRPFGYLFEISLRSGMVGQNIGEPSHKNGHHHGGGETDENKQRFQVGQERRHDADTVAAIRQKDQGEAEIGGEANRSWALVYDRVFTADTAHHQL